MVGDDVKNLFGLFIKSKGSDSIDKFFRRNVATVIVVEDVEAFFKLAHICLLEVFVGVFLWIKSLDYKSFTLLITLDMLLQ